MASERLPPKAHAALLENSCVLKRRVLRMDEGRARIKPRGSTLTSTQQAKRKLVFHFLGKVLPPYRSGILQRVQEKCNRVRANFFTIFLQSLFGKSRLWTLEFRHNTMRHNAAPQLTALRPQEYETLLGLGRETTVVRHRGFDGQRPNFGARHDRFEKDNNTNNTEVAGKARCHL